MKLEFNPKLLNGPTSVNTNSEIERLLKQKSLCKASFTLTYTTIMKLLQAKTKDSKALNQALQDLETKSHKFGNKCEEIMLADPHGMFDFNELSSEKYDIMMSELRFLK